MAQQQQPTLPLLIASLTALFIPPPTPAFLHPILNPPQSNSSSSTTRTPPLAALTATAKHRLLSASLTTAPSPLPPTAPSFPPDISDVRIQERPLGADVFAQVMDVVDLGRSRWEQVEGLEAERRGEGTRGREVIRVVPVGEVEGENEGSTQVQQTGDRASRGPFKILLHDHRGTAVWGFEHKRVERIGLPPLMGIGCKVLVRRGATVARGVVLLEPAVVVIFGGKIDALDKAWRADREGRLRREVEERGNREGEGEGEGQ